MYRIFGYPVVILLLIGLISSCSPSAAEQETAYIQFLEALEKEEPYIGFFATEKRLISEQTPGYLKARRSCFLGILESKEEPVEYVETFLAYCLEEQLLLGRDVAELERVLTVLSYELYANQPIFDFETDQVIAHREMEYANYPNKRLHLDLFVPKQPMDEPVPAVVCVHGGGWVVNRKVWFEPFAKYLAANGIAAVTIDYRKLPAVELIDCVYDAKAAVRWLRANADRYGIDPNRVGAMGASAGAHLATLLGTTADIPQLEGTGGHPDVSSEVQAVVGIATPVFSPKTAADLEDILGVSLSNHNLLSPYENVSSAAAPLFLVHGTADEAVPAENSQELFDKYKEMGAQVELKWIPDEGHGFYEGTDIAIKMATDFFKQQFSK